MSLSLRIARIFFFGGGGFPVSALSLKVRSHLVDNSDRKGHRSSQGLYSFSGLCIRFSGLRHFQAIRWGVKRNANVAIGWGESTLRHHSTFSFHWDGKIESSSHYLRQQDNSNLCIHLVTAWSCAFTLRQLEAAHSRCDSLKLRIHAATARSCAFMMRQLESSPFTSTEQNIDVYARYLGTFVKFGTWF
jgi:hypothetical protein